LLSGEYPDARIIKDIGSGLNWKRPGLGSLLEQVHQGNVKEVVVTYKDRLCRFGSEILEWIFKKSNVKLLVLSSSSDQKDITRELSDDLLAITTVFVARNNGLRAGHFRRERKAKEGIEKEEITNQISQ
jgi:predicted site-specific integrase-resolvase